MLMSSAYSARPRALSVPSFFGVCRPMTAYSVRSGAFMSVPTLVLELAGRVLDGLDDLDVTRAAAQMADHSCADIVLAWIWIFVQQRLSGEDEARRAKSALYAALLHERFLDLIENTTFGETFDRLDVLALRLHGEIEAGVDRLAVDENRASAESTFLAGALGPGQGETFPQHFEKRAPRRDENIVSFAINTQGDGQQMFHDAPPIASAAFSRAALTARLVKLFNSSKRNSRVARQDVRGSASSQTASAASSSASSAKARPRKSASAFLARIGTGALLARAILTSRKTRLPSSQVTKALTPTVVISID